MINPRESQESLLVQALDWGALVIHQHIDNLTIEVLQILDNFAPFLNQSLQVTGVASGTTPTPGHSRLQPESTCTGLPGAIFRGSK
jgi:hypothetical protein